LDGGKEKRMRGRGLGPGKLGRSVLRPYGGSVLYLAALSDGGRGRRRRRNVVGVTRLELEDRGLVLRGLGLGAGTRLQLWIGEEGGLADQMLSFAWLAEAV
jgi:hypothetical protein